jgi:hypothetical protein
MRKSLGVHVAEITDPMRIIDFLRNIWIAQILYTFSISTIKFSVLAFYWRLFSIKGRRTIYVVTFMSASWLIAIVRPQTPHFIQISHADPVTSSCSA